MKIKEREREIAYRALKDEQREKEREREGEIAYRALKDEQS